MALRATFITLEFASAISGQMMDSQLWAIFLNVYLSLLRLVSMKKNSKTPGTHNARLISYFSSFFNLKLIVVTLGARFLGIKVVILQTRTFI
jgi:hypothetical protein